jgi:glycosyltransferase involved in cell wall biosynthesis
VGRIFATRPLVIYSLAGFSLPLGLASSLGPRLADRQVLFFVGMSWHMENPEDARLLARQMRLYERRFPRHRLLIFANSETERSAIARHTRAVQLINQNIFVDEDVFRPLPSNPREFDAVYVARMTPWKRHELAQQIPRTVHVHYRERALSWPDTLAYLERLRRESPGHVFVNEIRDEAFVKLPPAEVNRVLNSAHVGLCLSAEEGAMLASMEYLLAGLPVVSTPSRGGRDHFFDPDFCLIVPPDPRAIREAVEALKARRIPQEKVRSRTLVRLRHERERLLDVLQAADPAVAAQLTPRPDWRSPFFKAAIAWRTSAEIEAEILARDGPLPELEQASS